MRRASVLLLALFGLIIAETQVGIAVLSATDSNQGDVKGTVTFTMINETHTSVNVSVSGLLAGPTARGVHIHQFGDLTDKATGLSTGSHFNPFNQSHGCESAGSARHVGDMGNWATTDNGTKIEMVKELDLLALRGANSIIGLGVVVHNQTDDCKQTTSSGARLAFGVIGIAQVTDNNAAPSPSSAVPNAIAFVVPTTTNSTFLSGVVYLSQADQSLSIQAIYNGINETHAHHIHQYGDLRATDGTGTGGHYNPHGSNHSIPPLSPRHVGDLGNVLFINDTAGHYSNVLTDGLTLVGGEFSILGRAVILHASPDNCKQPVGGAGGRIGYGVIGLANPERFPKTLDLTTGNVTQDISGCEVVQPTKSDIVPTRDGASGRLLAAPMLVLVALLTL